MKKFALLASFLAMPLIACGPTPCQQLKTDCDACTNTTAKGACNLIVTAGVQDACKITNDLGTYKSTSSVCTAANP